MHARSTYFFLQYFSININQKQKILPALYVTTLISRLINNMKFPSNLKISKQSKNSYQHNITFLVGPIHLFRSNQQHSSYKSCFKFFLEQSVISYLCLLVNLSQYLNGSLTVFLRPLFPCLSSFPHLLFATLNHKVT